MKCGNCPAGKRFAEGCVMCIQYGIIIREDHRCGREGWKEYEANDGHRGEVQGKTKIYDIREKTAGAGAGVLPGSGE